MYGFFHLTGRTLRLPLRNTYLKSYPELCSSGSAIYPHIITCVSQVIPKISSLTDDVFIPLFVTMKTNDSIYLIFYPNPEESPSIDPIVTEYWKTIEAMFLCKDINGYYLGTNKDSNLVRFKQCHESLSECYISQITSEYNESLCYTQGIKPQFSEKRIYLKSTDSHL